MKSLAIALFALALAFPALAHTQGNATPSHAASTLPEDARFEIVQSQLAAKWTFLLDRKCGAVSQLVRTQDDDNAWEQMIVVGLRDCKPDGPARFQIFSSSLAARHTFLIDTSTGRTWTLTSYTDKDGIETNGWSPFSR